MIVTSDLTSPRRLARAPKGWAKNNCTWSSGTGARSESICGRPDAPYLSATSRVHDVHDVGNVDKTLALHEIGTVLWKRSAASPVAIISW